MLSAKTAARLCVLTTSALLAAGCSPKKSTETPALNSTNSPALSSAEFSTKSKLEKELALAGAVENARADIIRSLLREPLDPELCASIKAALDLQFSVTNQSLGGPEIGGLVLRAGRSLSLTPYESALQRATRKALKNFEEGSYTQTDISLLQKALDDTWDLKAQFLGCRSREMTYLSLIKLGLQTAREPEPLAAPRRAEISKLLRAEVLDPSYTILLAEIPQWDLNFRGLFHVHPNGSAPSKGDIINNQINHLPVLVLSATNSERAQIFLITKGVVESLPGVLIGN